MKAVRYLPPEAAEFSVVKPSLECYIVIGLGPFYRCIFLPIIKVTILFHIMILPSKMAERIEKQFNLVKF